MNLLILGGTIFLGRHLVAAARAAGHHVTTFNRGSNVIDEQKDIEKLTGDRAHDLSALAGRKWDAVIDTCGYEPTVVAKSIEALKASVSSYVFISTISVYHSFQNERQDEKAQLKSVEENRADDYGALKVACERAILESMPDHSLIIRPGLIVGPHDPSDRFTYWPERVARGGRVMAPGRAQRQVQFIDARDLSEWIIRLVEAGATGVFNATGPDYALTMEHFLEECNQALGNKAQIAWIDEESIMETEIEPWTEFPLWIPETEESFRGFMSIDCSAAFKAGLTCRPIADTVRDTYAWDARRSKSGDRKAGLTDEREQELRETVARRSREKIRKMSIQPTV